MNDSQLLSTLFLDIETVSGYANYSGMSDRMKALWQKKGARFLPDGKSRSDATEDDWQEVYQNRAAILAEFGRIICISVGFLRPNANGRLGMRVKSFAHKDELTVLTEFAALVEEVFAEQRIKFFCGHNVREFDLPYICRRMLIHGLALPSALQLQGKRPWELKHILDTMELWKFGDYKHFTSLDLLAECFGIPSPKEDMDGSMVGPVFYEENDLDRIRTYCERDVWVTACVLCKLKQSDYPDEKDVMYL